ncbi:MAG TPA: peptide-methionine (S)-S-oxide reductase MsrA [Steroidobacteraceae bacterium]
MLRTLSVGLALVASVLSVNACGSEAAVKIPAPAFDAPAAPGKLQTAVVAGGCFWGVQGVYQHLKGVKSVLSGYAGGDGSRADYESVSAGDSGHAESVQIVYDPAQVTYGQILQVFFSVAHDPTQLNRQGPDTGTQYRSAIFYTSDTQKKIAQDYIAQLDKGRLFPRQIVTRVDPLKQFYEAESYHQDYLLNHPSNPYIVINDLPKVRNFQSTLPSLYVDKPVTVRASKRDAKAAPAAPVGGGAMMMAAAEKPAEGGAMMSAQGASGPSKTEGPLPPLTGATGWLNSKPLTPEGLRGKVVVVDFWAYSCINGLRAMPYVNAWYRHYKDSGLVVLGVHSPEFAFEKDIENVRAAVKKFDIQYPVALDSGLEIWKAFNNRFWPAHYFVDAKGQIRGHHFGEGKYAKSEREIRRLLVEAGAKNLPDPLDEAAGEGVAKPADMANVASPETYVGYARAENFVSPGAFARDAKKSYAIPKALTLNQWALAGPWQVAREHARLDGAPGRIAFRFKARDLHLVLGPASSGKPVRFRVTLGGAPPKTDAGMDVDANGNGVVREHRLYQLIREKGPVAEQEFVIEFLDAGVDAYSFTFG